MPIGCAIDWTATGTMLQGIGTFGGAIAGLVAAVIGANTFSSWSQQKDSERRADQAERILTATYKVRRALSRVRSPAMWGHEFVAAEAVLRENGEWEKVFGGEPERRRLATTQAYYTRLHGTQDQQRELEECQPMARALFGEPLENALEELNHQFWTVKVYVDANQGDGANADADFRHQINCALWQGYKVDGKNEVDEKIAASVKLIEDTCVPALRLQRTKNLTAKK